MIAPGRTTRLAPAVALALGLGAAPAAGADAPGKLRDDVLAYRLDARLDAPASVPWSASRLGRVVLPVHFTLANSTGQPAPVAGRGVVFVARNALAVYPCESRASGEERWPREIAPRASFVTDRAVTCETVLPGEHVLEARWAGAPASSPPLARAPFRVAAARSAPVPLATRPDLVALLTGTRDVVPSNEPRRVRLVLGLANVGTAASTLPTLEVDVALHMRGSELTCRDHRVVELRGELAPGKLHVVWMPLSCALPYQGVWETDVTVREPGRRAVRLPSHAVHVWPSETVTP